MKNPLLLLTLISLASATPALASVQYSCLPMGDHDIQDDITLVVKGEKVVSVGDDLARADENYDPRLNEGFARFVYDHSEEGVSEILVQERLLNGAPSGFIKIQHRGEGFSSQKYSCKATD